MKTKMVIINEQMLGYIVPQDPTHAGILQGSAARGATHFWSDGPIFLSPSDNVRLATPNDFIDYRVHDGYTIRPNEYEFQPNFPWGWTTDDAYKAYEDFAVGAESGRSFQGFIDYQRELESVHN